MKNILIITVIFCLSLFAEVSASKLSQFQALCRQNFSGSAYLETILNMSESKAISNRDVDYLIGEIERGGSAIQIANYLAVKDGATRQLAQSLEEKSTSHQRAQFEATVGVSHRELLDIEDYAEALGVDTLFTPQEKKEYQERREVARRSWWSRPVQETPTTTQPSTSRLTDDQMAKIRSGSAMAGFRPTQTPVEERVVIAETVQPRTTRTTATPGVATPSPPAEPTVYKLTQTDLNAIQWMADRAYMGSLRPEIRQKLQGLGIVFKVSAPGNKIVNVGKNIDDTRRHDLLVSEAIKRGIRPQFARAIMSTESGGRWPSRPSSAGARGYMQIMPSTAKGDIAPALGVSDSLILHDKHWNIVGGVYYIWWTINHFAGNNVRRAAISYNAGIGRRNLSDEGLRELARKNKKFNATEAIHYVRWVTAYRALHFIYDEVEERQLATK